MKGHKKSMSRKRETTKSTLEKKSTEEDELKNYEALLMKLAQAIIHKDKPINQIEGDSSSNKRSPSAGTWSNFKLTASRTKDERNDKDFLINFMNSESSTLISPKNLHLLSDDDRNKSITNTEKFKNLSNLMLEDKNAYSECYFIKNSEDRMILNLYTILGRKSKELFLEEDDDKEKISKTRLLFKKLNNITFPKFDIKKNKKEKINKVDYEQNNKGLDEEINIDLKSNESEDKKEESLDLYSDEDIQKNKDECYFKKKEKHNFILPDLIDIKNYKKIRRKIRLTNKENYENFWDPELDANALSNINHNFVRIEDIYNEKEKNIENEEDINNEDNLEVNAEEIKSSDSESEEEKENKVEIKDTEEMLKKGKNRFIEFFEVSPVQMGLSFLVDSKKVKEYYDNLELKEMLELKLDEINEFEEKVFPKKGYKLSSDLIYRIAINNDTNIIEENERFTIEPSYEKNIKSKKKLDKHHKKIIIERKANLNKSKGKLTEEPLTIKRTHVKFKTISDYANRINIKKKYILDDNLVDKFENKEKIKKDSSLQLDNKEISANEKSIKDLMNNESLFSNKTNEFINDNNKDGNKNKTHKNKKNNKNKEKSKNSSNSNTNSQLDSKIQNNSISKLYSDNENSSKINANN